MADSNQREVLARYGNWFHEDDDLFAHCLILGKGDWVRLFQGLQVVTVETGRADESAYRRLVELLEDGIPAGWPTASYQGYNFITDAEGANASEIAVYGQQSSGQLAGYFAAPADSEIGELVKEIAQVD